MKEQVLAVQRMQDYIENNNTVKSAYPILRGYRCFLHGMPTGFFETASG